MAAYCREKNEFISLCKLGTGFNHEELQQITERYQKHNYILKKIPNNYIIPKSLRPKFFFAAKEVWEVGFDSFSKSVNYNIGNNLSEDNLGLSLRFPRFIKFRSDKDIKDANSPDQIIEMFNNIKI